jgi:transposase
LIARRDFLLPPSVDEWLPEKHLSRFLVEVIEGLDASAMCGAYRGSGSASYHPRLLLGILIYSYATGVFSSRKLERATYDSVAFRFIAANDHPDHDTSANGMPCSAIRSWPPQSSTACSIIAT